MMEKKKWTYCVISVLLFTAIVLAVILTNRSGPVTNVHVGYDYPVAANLPEMAEAAQVVVIGKYDRFDSAWNMARDPNNTLREDPDNYTEGRLYAFTVDQVLKGEIAGPNILVNHRYAETHTVKESDAKVNAEGVITGNASSEREVSYTIHDPLYIAPELGEPYILLYPVFAKGPDLWELLRRNRALFHQD